MAPPPIPAPPPNASSTLRGLVAPQAQNWGDFEKIFRGSVPFVRADLLGFVPNDFTQAAANVAAWNAAMAAIPLGGVQRWVFPPGTYFFDGTLNVRRQMIIEGPAGIDSGQGAYFRFLSSVGDNPLIRIHDYSDLLGDGRNTIIRNLRITGPTTPLLSNQHGILVQMVCHLEHLFVEYCGGDGIHIFANVDANSNANGWKLLNVTSGNNYQNGFNVHGNDANGGAAFGCVAIQNAGAGFWEHSFLGNNYFGCLAEANAGNGEGGAATAYRVAGSATNMSVFAGSYVEAPQKVDIGGRAIWLGGVIDSDGQIVGGSLTLWNNQIWGHELEFIINNNRPTAASATSGGISWGGGGNQVGRLRFPADVDPRSPELSLISEFSGLSDEGGNRVTKAWSHGSQTGGGMGQLWLTTLHSVLAPTSWGFPTDQNPVFWPGFFAGICRVIGPISNSFNPATPIIGNAWGGHTFAKGSLSLESFFDLGGYSMLRCTDDGTSGTYTEGLTITGNLTSVATLSAPSTVLKIGQFIKIGGSGKYKILDLNGTSITLWAPVAAGSHAIDYYNPTFVPFAELTGNVPDATGTPGAVEQDTLKGRVAIAGGQSSVVVTNSKVGINSMVFAVLQTDDATATGVKCVVCANGSFTIKLNAAATGIVKLAWHLKE